MRLILAGTGSGCGKTTVSLALMTALRARGKTVAPFKIGPDYIDPGFHAKACGRPSDNLDLFLLKEREVRSLLARGEADADLALAEGVMGYYDGLDSASMQASTWDTAIRTQTPVALIVDASGTATSVAAVVKGFQALRSPDGIRAVLVNRASSHRHFQLIQEAVKHYCHLPCIGWMERSSELYLPSRHLGLVPAQETDALPRLLQKAALRLHMEEDALETIAAQAPTLETVDSPLPNRRGYRLGVAMDEAFSFYYPENLRLLTKSGMELVYFSPLRDEHLPEGLNGLYLGGGFPEVFASRLEENVSMRQSLKAALTNGLRCYGECGGLLYLSASLNGRQMIGYLPLRCRMTDRLQHFGYVLVSGPEGQSLPAHEFHHAVAEPLGPVTPGFKVQKASAPGQLWESGCRLGNTVAAFPHLHFASYPQ